ncbi:hypothetical protein OH799_13795 [Nocardia sp. NBC_00881]|nr:hypothetical protein OH799_13795 [Nocardia sp. NBC_00881]
MLMWRGLSDATPSIDQQALAEADLVITRARRERGLIAADLDPATSSSW